MWKAIESELVEFSADQHNEHLPEIKLVCAIMTMGAREHDDKYFEEQRFIDHCYYLKLHSKFVLSLFKRAWRVEKSGVLWEYTNPMKEDDNAN